MEFSSNWRVFFIRMRMGPVPLSSLQERNIQTRTKNRLAAVRISVDTLVASVAFNFFSTLIFYFFGESTKTLNLYVERHVQR